MTTNNNEIALAMPDDESGDDETQPTFTWSEAKRSGLATHESYVLTAKIRIIVVKFHERAGTPRNLREPTELAGGMLSDFYNKKANELLETTCAENLDPLVQMIEDQGNQIDTTVEAVADRDPRLSSSETGINYTEEEAVDQVESNQARINTDKKKGRSHHKRVRRFVRVLGKIMPYGEALGLIVLLSYWLNVNWLKPWQDPLTFTLALVIVAATLIFTPRVDERSGEGWNGRREAIADGHTEAIQANTRKLVINGIIAAAICAVFVAGLVERALAVTDDSVPESMLALLIALCVIAGVAMPAFAWIAKAWDGSSQSRENDDLIEQLDDGLAEDQELRTEARSTNIACEQNELHINTEVAPAIYRGAYEVAEEERRAYGWLRVQIGGLPSATPTRPADDLAAEDIRRSIPTGIPGTEPIRLDPLVDRGLRLKELQKRRSDAMARLAALPAHPWSGNQDAA